MDTVYISENSNKLLVEYLTALGLKVVFISPPKHITTGISTHPDIYMCKLGADDRAMVFLGEMEKISNNYPGDIIYNAACSGRFFIHNLKYTDKELLATATAAGMTLVNTRQGYSKCSTAIVDEDSFITSDEAIAIPLRAAGAEVLLINKGHIKLRGYDMGFIGGTCGRIGKTMVFNGNLSAHPDFEKIKEFIQAKGLSLKYFPEYPLEDIGSIILCRKDVSR